MKQDEIELLRKIADHGMQWRLSSPSPVILKANVLSSSEGEQVDAEQVGKLVEAGILATELVDYFTSSPRVLYALTDKGSQRVIDSFKNLIKGIQPNKIVYSPIDANVEKAS